ncbi:MAG TPA: hypothetical protein VHE35_32745 [Kofleriaceae bacterium]|nr:hypothetical protein [Kofleriaceae bacterium]
MSEAPAPATAEASARAAYLGEVLDALVAEHTGDEELVVAARGRFEDRRGKIYQDEELWETWSAGFVEWLVTEYVPPLRDLPLAADSLAAARAAGDERRARAIAAWLTSHRSLWAVEKLGPGHVDLFDLLGGAHVRVTEPRGLHGVAVGEVAEMRVIGFEGEVWFGRAFLFHPRGTRDALLEQARAITAAGGDRRAVLDRAASLRVKGLRYKHVPAAKLYERGGGKVS